MSSSLADLKYCIYGTFYCSRRLSFVKPFVNYLYQCTATMTCENNMSTQFNLPYQAQDGFNDAASYDQHRPSYPSDAVEKLLVNLGVANQTNARIVELACGTGKFTEALIKRPEKYEVVAVEPHAGMREALVKKNLGADIKIIDGDASNMSIGEDWGDALIAAQVSNINSSSK